MSPFPFPTTDDFPYIFEFCSILLNETHTHRDHLLRQIERIIAQAGPSPSPIPIGALTSDNRDKWAEAREALVASGSGINAKSLEAIESAMIIVCLDDTRPVTREDISWGTWVGDGRNRFYDKHQRKEDRGFLFGSLFLSYPFVLVFGFCYLSRPFDS